MDGKGYVKVMDLQTSKKTCTFVLHIPAILYPSCHQEGLRELQTQAVWTVLWFGKSVWEGVLLLSVGLLSFWFGWGVQNCIGRLQHRRCASCTNGAPCSKKLPPASNNNKDHEQNSSPYST